MEVYLLIIVFVLAGVCLHINIIIADKHSFYTVLRIVLIFLLLQVTVEFIGSMLAEQFRYIGWAAPFGLMYGPLIYFAYLSANESVQEKKKIVIHGFPFLLAMPCYILFLLSSSTAGGSIRFVYSSLLYAAMASSWLIYAVWVICLDNQKKEKSSIEFNNLISTMAIIMLTLAIFYLIMIYTRALSGITTTLTPSLFFDLGMFSIAIFIYRFTIRRFRERPVINASARRPALLKDEIEGPKLEYQKSSLTEEAMVAYSKRVTAFIESRCYLDTELSLGKMAAELKIPKHHLSQLFSQHYKQFFLQYINMLRIRHACSILQAPDSNINIADLAEQCGFKSKPSFYRNFKTIMGMTPTEFLIQDSSSQDLAENMNSLIGMVSCTDIKMTDTSKASEALLIMTT